MFLEETLRASAINLSKLDFKGHYGELQTCCKRPINLSKLDFKATDWTLILVDNTAINLSKLDFKEPFVQSLQSCRQL